MPFTLHQPHDAITLSDSDSLSADDIPLPKDRSGGHIPRSKISTASEENEASGTDDLPSALSELNTISKAKDLLEYDPEDYNHLEVSPEVHDLLKYIQRYKGKKIDLDTKLKPFIPDYIPAIGDVDEFIKVPRPDSKQDFLGLKVLDEPGATQSDPTILNLQLRQQSKQAKGEPVDVVGRVEHSERDKSKTIDRWIQNITDIHKKQPPASVHHSSQMPEIEVLMEEWLPEVEDLLKSIKLPSDNLDIELQDFVQIVCNILDIPIRDNPIQSLHILFTLYLEFKNHPYLKQNNGANGLEVGSVSNCNDAI